MQLKYNHLKSLIRFFNILQFKRILSSFVLKIQLLRYMQPKQEHRIIETDASHFKLQLCF